MISKLLRAYRREFYMMDHETFQKVRKIKWAWNSMWLIVIAGTIGAIWILISDNYYWGVMTALVALGCIVLKYADYRATKDYELHIKSKKNHIDKVIVFLRTVVGGVDLYDKKHIEMLVSELDEMIEKKDLIAKVMGGINGFVKSVVFPVTAYFAGILSHKFMELDVEYMFQWAITVVIWCFLVWVFFCLTKLYLEMEICGNREIAVCFRTDLKDILFLYFSEEEKE